MSGKQRTPRQLYEAGRCYGAKNRLLAAHPLRKSKSFLRGYRAGIANFVRNSA